MRTTPALLLLACAYEARVDPDAAGPGNVITGTVTVTDVDQAAPVVLFLAAADDPMPPLGTGSPVSFTTVPGREFTQGTSGVRSATYAFTDVPDGDWVITAVMDGDWNFHPAVPTLAGATCRDIVGAHLASLSGTTPAVVSITGGELVPDVAVLLARSLPVPRPTFTVAQGAVPAGVPFAPFQLASAPISAEMGPSLQLNVSGPFDPLAPDTCDAAFWVHPVDADGDGAVDPHPDYPPEAGVPDVWPRVYLRWLGEPVDLDDDGVVDTFDRGDDDATYATEGLPWLLQLTSGTPETQALIGATFPVTTLDVSFAGTIVRTDPDGTQTPLVDPATFPGGAWSVTVIAETGQTWTVPNELDTALDLGASLPPPGVTSPRDATQGTWVVLPGP